MNSDNAQIPDFDKIAAECLIASDADSDLVVEKLENIKKNFSDIELIALFNYFLQIEKNPCVLCKIIITLDKFRDSSSLELFTKLLLMEKPIEDSKYTRDDYTNVRVLCAKAISNMKNPSSVHPLLHCLNNKDENYKVRLSCADALGRLGNKYAVATLMEVVSDEEEKSLYIRESAAVALGLIGDMRAVDSLVRVIESKNGILSKFTYLKEKALEALCRLGPSNDRTFKVLKNSLDDENPQVRINAIEGLMDYDLPEALQLIKNMLNDEDEEVQRNAVIAVFNICGEESMHEIINDTKYSQICKDEAQSILENKQDYEE